MSHVINDISAALHTAAIERLAPTEETLLQQLYRMSQTYQAIATQHGLQFGIRSSSPESWSVKIFDAAGQVLYSDTIKRKNSISAFLREAEAFKAALLELPIRLSSLSELINGVMLEMGVEGAVFVHPTPEPAAPVEVVVDMAKKKTDKKYIAYYRVSTQKQGRSGLGLEAQKADVQRFVHCDDCIIDEYTETESGKTSDRPELIKAIAKCLETGATLIVSKLDRLSRDVEFIFKLMNSKVKFQCVEIPEMNTLTVGLFAIMAEHERNLISTRTKAAFAAKKARGEKKGYGKTMTREVIDASIKARQEAAWNDEFALRAFPLIQSLRKEGKTYRHIADVLNTSKYTTKNGKPYSPTAVLRIEKRYTENKED